MSKLPKKRRTFDEMAVVVADFEASGLTQKAFAEHCQIPIATFSYWLRKVRNQSNSSATKFLAVETTDSFPPLETAPIELVSPNGWILRLTQPPQNIRAILPLLEIMATPHSCSR